MDLTDVNEGKPRFDRIVNPVKVMVPPMEFKSLPLRLVMLTAPVQDRSPLICSMPSRTMAPVIVEPMDISPSTVEHCEARLVASAGELMVTVDWEQREEDCAALETKCQSIFDGERIWDYGGPEWHDLPAANPSTARPGRRYLVANMVKGNYVDYYEMSVQLNAID